MISSELSNEKNVNYGLDYLSIEIENKKYIEKDSHIPETNIIRKLSRFSLKDFYFRWSLLTFTCILYNFISVPYLLAFGRTHNDFWLIFEFLSECILFCDFLGLIFLSKFMNYTYFWHLNEKQSTLASVFLLLSSVPYIFIAQSANINKASIVLALINCLKLLRIHEINSFLNKIEISLKFGSSIKKIAKFLIILLFTVHYYSCLWIFTARVEVLFSADNWQNHLELNQTSETDLYIEGLLWSSETLTGVVIHTSPDFSLAEKIISTLAMISSIIISSVIYSKFIQTLAAVNSNTIETQEQLKKTMEWGRQIKLPDEVLYKINVYFSDARNRFDYLLNFDFVNELPFTLKSEVSLCAFQDLIDKVKFFSLGEPTFIVAFIRHLRPRLYMKGDIIIEAGEYPDEFYIIRYGTVEVLASDQSTQIALMESGSFFGEIGIILNVLRTVTVRAYSAVILCCMQRADFLSILEEFPFYFSYFQKVAEQRKATRDPEDVDTGYDLLDESISSNDSDVSDELERPKVFTEAEHSEKPFLHKIFTVPNSNAPSDYLIIDPLSSFHYVWSILLVVTYILFVLYIPFSIAFESVPSKFTIALSFVAYFIFVLDILVSTNTALMTDYKVYYHKKEDIMKHYIIHYLYSDIISLVPLDLIFTVIDAPLYISAYLRIFRLFKYPRVKSVIRLLLNELHLVYKAILLIISLFYFIIHYLACLHLYSAKLQVKYFGEPDYYNNYSIDEYGTLADLVSKSATEQYLSLIYWSAGIISTSGYSNLFPLTQFSKVFIEIVLVFAHVLTLFLYALLTKVSYVANIRYVNYIKKALTLDLWMANKRISEDLKNKINNYYQLIWEKSAGINEQEILSELPAVLQKDTLNHLFDCVRNCSLFPANQSAPIYTIMKKCRIECFCAEEDIITSGDLILDVFFIIEGTVKCVDPSFATFRYLKKGDYFCEEPLISDDFFCCEISYLASDDVRLAALRVKDYREIIKDYPEFEININTKINNSEKSLSEDIQVIKSLPFINETSINLATEINTGVYSTREGSKEIVKESTSRCQKLIYKLFTALYVYVMFWNGVFVPYYIGTGCRLESYGIFSECLTTCVYYYFCAFNFFTMKERKISLSFTYHVFAGFPVLLFSELISRNDELLVIYGVFRILNIYLFPEFISQFTRNHIAWYKTLRFTSFFMIYFYYIHLASCIFLAIGRLGPKNNWLDQVDSDSDLNRYILAFYWASNTVFHSSFGDIKLKNNLEKSFAILSFFFGWVVSCLIFGSICSILLVLSSKLKSNLQSSYEYVKHYLKKKKVFKFFSRSIETYYNHEWNFKKGVDEKALFEELNRPLKVALQIFIYSKPISLATVFKDFHGRENPNLIRSVFSVIKYENFFTGETIIKAADRSQDMFIILLGQVDVLDLKGTKVLATLNQGAHFGEANIVLKNDFRTATIIATQMTTLGVLEKEDLVTLFKAFPEWYSMLEKVVLDRMERTFNSRKSDEIFKNCQSVLDKINKSPAMRNLYTVRSVKLISEKIAEIEMSHKENEWQSLYLFHSVFLVYSFVEIPLILGFFLDKPLILLGMEVIIIIESIVFLLKNTNFILVIKEYKRFSCASLLRYCYYNHLFADIAAVSPFHLIYLLKDHKGLSLFALLSLTRLSAVYRVFSIIEIFEFENRKLVKYFKILHVLLKTFFMLHFTCCVWGFCVHTEPGQPWLAYSNLESSGLPETYEVCLYYIINIVSATGYNNISPITRNERIVSIIISIFGIVFLTNVFGYVTSNSTEETQDIMKIINKIKTSLHAISRSEVPGSVKSRIQEFYTFSAYLNNKIGGVHMEVLYNHLPKRLVKSIIFKCNNSLLKKLPLLKNITNTEAIEYLTLNLDPQIYLKDDFIIYKNDLGKEMFFILIGSVNVLAQDNQKILKTLKKGEFFGEVALVHDSKRMCSVVASKPSLIYSLKKEIFLGVLEKYPEILDRLKVVGENRKNENWMIKTSSDSQRSLKNGLLSCISRTFFARQETCRIVQVLNGMNKFTPDVVANCLDSDVKSRMHTRRPQVGVDIKRRMSQENLINGV